MFKTFQWRHYIEIFFFCNQFCSFLFFTKIINICFSKWVFFFYLNQKILFKKIINLLKIWKRTGSVAFSTSLKIGWNEWKKLFQKTKKNNVTFRFPIFLFVITETKIHSIRKMDSFSAFVSSCHNISFLLLLKIISFGTLLLCMTYWIEN